MLQRDQVVGDQCTLTGQIVAPRFRSIPRWIPADSRAPRTIKEQLRRELVARFCSRPIFARLLKPKWATAPSTIICCSHWDWPVRPRGSRARNNASQVSSGGPAEIRCVDWPWRGSGRASRVGTRGRLMRFAGLPPVAVRWPRRCGSCRRSRSAAAASACPVAPGEDAFQIADRIDHVRHLPGSREEMLMDEAVAVGQENAEVRMRVIPADDPLVGESRVHLLVDLRPRLVRERDLGKLAGRVVAADVVGDAIANGPSSSRSQPPTSTPQISTVTSALACSLDAATDFRRDVQAEIGAASSTGNRPRQLLFRPDLHVDAAHGRSSPLANGPEHCRPVAGKFVASLFRSAAAGDNVPRRHAEFGERFVRAAASRGRCV